MRYLVSILVLIVVFASCEKTIDIEIPDEGRKLTVNSLFTEDNTLLLNLTQSKYILDGEWAFGQVENADIQLFEDGKLIEKLVGEQGYYYSVNNLKIAKEYSVEISANGFPDVKAKNTIPKVTKIENFSLTQDIDQFGYPTVGFELQFQDKPGTDNYYFIEIYERVIFTYIDEETGEELTDEYTTPIYLSSNDLNTLQDEWGINDGVYINGELINGRLYTIALKSTSTFDLYDNQGNNLKDKYGTSYFVSFHSISKDYFQYIKSLNKQTVSNDDFFMEPVQVFSNVENGFGIFAGMSTDVDSIIVEPTL